MTNRQKVKMLRFLHQALGQTSPLSLRVLGISENDARQLASERLVSLGVDNSKPEMLDQYSIIEILDAGLVLLTKNPERTPMLSKIGKAAFGGMWDLLKVGAGVLLGWYLRKHFG